MKEEIKVLCTQLQSVKENFQEKLRSFLLKFFFDEFFFLMHFLFVVCLVFFI